MKVEPDHPQLPVVIYDEDDPGGGAYVDGELTFPPRSVPNYEALERIFYPLKPQGKEA